LQPETGQTEKAKQKEKPVSQHKTVALVVAVVVLMTQTLDWHKERGRERERERERDYLLIYLILYYINIYLLYYLLFIINLLLFLGFCLPSAIVSIKAEPSQRHQTLATSRRQKPKTFRYWLVWSLAGGLVWLLKLIN